MELFSQSIKTDKDILATRDRARVISEELGFTITQQLQVTTSVFELGKNILEHGQGGEIQFSLQSEDDNLTLEIVGRDQGPGMSPEEINAILQPGSRKSTANRGLAAMKRLMDSMEIESSPGSGTVIHLIKEKRKSTKTLAENIVGFLQEKFTARNKLTLSEELRKQNINLVQTLSLYEEKNEELEKKNKELLDLKQQLEESNEELQNRTMELQEALLSLGDRTSELEAQNRRFNAVLEEIPGGVVITDRSGVVTKSNHQFHTLFHVEEESLEELQKMGWYSFLSKYKTIPEEEWTRMTVEWDDHPTQVYEFTLSLQNGTDQKIPGRSVPILDGDQKYLGRIWIFIT